MDFRSSMNRGQIAGTHTDQTAVLLENGHKSTEVTSDDVTLDCNPFLISRSDRLAESMMRHGRSRGSSRTDVLREVSLEQGERRMGHGLIRTMERAELRRTWSSAYLYKQGPVTAKLREFRTRFTCRTRSDGTVRERHRSAQPSTGPTLRRWRVRDARRPDCKDLHLLRGATNRERKPKPRENLSDV